jgi:hypothetical protein
MLLTRQLNPHDEPQRGTGAILCRVAAIAGVQLRSDATAPRGEREPSPADRAPPLVLGRGLSTWDRAGAHRPLRRTFRQGATQVIQLLSGRKSIPNWPHAPRLDFPYRARSHSAPIPSSNSGK